MRSREVLAVAALVIIVIASLYRDVRYQAVKAHGVKNKDSLASPAVLPRASLPPIGVLPDAIVSLLDKHDVISCLDAHLQGAGGPLVQLLRRPRQTAKGTPDLPKCLSLILAIEADIAVSASNGAWMPDDGLPGIVSPPALSSFASRLQLAADRFYLLSALRLRCLKAAPRSDGMPAVVTAACIGGPEQAWGLGLDGTIHISIPKISGGGGSSRGSRLPQSQPEVNNFCLWAAANGTVELRHLGPAAVDRAGRIAPDTCSSWVVVGTRMAGTDRGDGSGGAGASAPPGLLVERATRRCLVSLEEVGAPAEWAGAVAVAACTSADPLQMLWTPLSASSLFLEGPSLPVYAASAAAAAAGAAAGRLHAAERPGLQASGVLPGPGSGEERGWEAAAAVERGRDLLWTMGAAVLDAHAQSLGNLLVEVAAETAAAGVGAMPLAADTSGTTAGGAGGSGRPWGSECRDPATWVAPTAWGLYPGLYALEQQGTGRSGAGRPGELDHAGSRRLSFLLPAPRECVLRFPPLSAHLAAAELEATLGAYNPALARLPPDAPLSATGARFVVVGRLSNWQMRAWPVLSKRVGAFDGVNAFRWRKPARTGGFPYPPERVEAFINLPALLLLDDRLRPVGPPRLLTDGLELRRVPCDGMVHDMLGHRMDVRLAIGEGGDVWATAWVQTRGCVPRMQVSNLGPRLDFKRPWTVLQVDYAALRSAVDSALAPGTAGGALAAGGGVGGGAGRHRRRLLAADEEEAGSLLLDAEVPDAAAEAHSGSAARDGAAATVAAEAGRDAEEAEEAAEAEEQDESDMELPPDDAYVPLTEAVEAQAAAGDGVRREAHGGDAAGERVGEDPTGAVLQAGPAGARRRASPTPISEKNWVPFFHPHGSELLLLHSLNPLVVLAPDFNTGMARPVHVSHHPQLDRFQAAGGRLHLGTNLAHLPLHGIFLGVAHARHPQQLEPGPSRGERRRRHSKSQRHGGESEGGGGQKYYDLWYPKFWYALSEDPPFAVKAVSPQFCVGHRARGPPPSGSASAGHGGGGGGGEKRMRVRCELLQYATGLALGAGGRRIVLSYGVMDSEARLAEFSLREVLGSLGLPDDDDNDSVDSHEEEPPVVRSTT